MRKTIWIALMLSIATGGGYWLAAEADDPEPRTYYESLALDTPETAIETFMAAFQRQDYWTVYLIFTPRTQLMIRQNVNLLYYDPLMHVDGWDDSAAVIGDQSIASGQEYWEHIETGYFFDEIMLAATQHERLLIDLRGAFTLGDRAERLTEDGDPVVEVTVAVDGIEEPVVFQLFQTFSQRWRIQSVILSGGDPEEASAPWIVPQAKNE